ncbi:hypothetical protein PTKU46_95320 [Paraburkholderia terrae]
MCGFNRVDVSLNAFLNLLLTLVDLARRVFLSRLFTTLNLLPSMATVSADIGSSIALKELPRTIERVRAMVPPDLARNGRFPHQKIVFSTGGSCKVSVNSYHKLLGYMAARNHFELTW